MGRKPKQSAAFEAACRSFAPFRGRTQQREMIRLPYNHAPSCGAEWRWLVVKRARSFHPCARALSPMHGSM